MAQDLYYYESGYIDVSYFVYTADAESAVSASSSLACDAEVIAGGVIVEGSSSWMSSSSVTADVNITAGGQVSLSSAFSQTATISHIEGADLFAMSEAALAAEVSRIRDNNISASSAFSIATDASRTRNYSSDEAADFSIAVDNLRVRYDEAAIDAAFSLTADARALVLHDASFEITTELSATALRIHTTTADFASETSLTADLTRKPGVEVTASGAWSSEFTIDAKGTRKTNIIDCDISAEFTQSTAVQRSAGLEADFETVTFITSADFVRTRAVSADLTVTASQSANVNETVQLAADLTSTASVSATISHIEGADLFAMSNASLASDVNAIRGLSSDLSSAFTQTTEVLRIKSSAVALSSQFTQTVLAGLSIIADADLSSTTSLVTTKYFGTGRPKTLSIPGTSTYFDSAVKKFGSHSLNVQSTIEDTTYSTTRPKVGQSWVVETWLYRTTASGDSQLISFNWISIATNSSRQPSVNILDSSGAFAMQTGNLTALTASTWTHVAIVSDGSRISVYTGGTRRYTTTTMPASYTGVPDIAFRARETGASDAGRIDETSIYVGTTLGFDPSQTTITVPTQPRTNDSQYTRVLYHFDNDGVDTTVGIETAQATLASTSSVTAELKVIPGGVVNAASQFTLSAQADAAVRSASASLQANGFVVAVNARIRPQTAELSSAFTTLASGQRIRYAQAALSSACELSATAQDLDIAEIALTSQFTLSATATRSRGIISTEPSQFTLTARATKTISTWGSDSWYKGLTNGTSHDLAVLESNVYEVGIANTPTDRVYLISRDIARGNANWQLDFDIPTGASATTHQPVVKAYNGYVYVGISYVSSGSYRAGLAQIDPDTQTITQTIQIKCLDRLYDFAIDDSGIYVSGMVIDASGSNPVVGRYALDGAFDWANKYDITSNYITDDNAKLYIRTSALYWTFEVENITTHTLEGHITKIDSTDGSVIEHRTTGLDYSGGIFVDSDESIYITGSTTTPLNENGRLIRVLSNGTVDWAYQGINIVEDGIVRTDESGNVYVLDQETPAIHKFTSTGEHIWGKQLTADSKSLLALLPYDDRVLLAGSLNLESLGINVAQVDGDNEHTNIPFPTAYTASGTWSWTDITPGWTSTSYSLPSTTSLTTVSQPNTRLGFAPTTTANTSTAFTFLYIVDCIGSWSATTSQTIAYTRIRPGASSQTVQATQTTTALKKVILEAAMSSEAQTSATLLRVRASAVDMSSTSTMTVSGTKFTGYAADLAVTLEQTTSANRLRGIVATESSAFTQVTNNTRTRAVSAEFTAFYTELAVAYRNATGTILLEAICTMTIAARKTTDSPQYLFAQTNMLASGVNTQFGRAVLTTSAELNLVPTYLRRNEAQLTATTALAVPGERIRPGASSQAVQFFAFPATDNSKIVGYSSALATTSQMLTNNQILRLAQANLQTNATMPLAFIGVLVRTEANLQVNGFQLTAGKVINIDLYYQLKIPSETRTLWIEPESRILSIDSETRVNKIKGYPSP